jgi:elongation factor G
MKIINLGIFAHIDAGKTTLTEQILHLAGVIPSRGSIEEGTTESDTLSVEIERGISIVSSLLQFEYKCKTGVIKFNIIDTPGHLDFRNQADSILDTIDIAIVLIDGSRGVESQTTLLHKSLQDKQIPEIFFVNKLDRSSEYLSDTLISIQDLLQKTPSILFHTNDYQSIWDYPDHFSEKDHLELFEWNDEFSAKYLQEPNRLYELSVAGLISGIVKSKIYAVLGGSAFLGTGVRELLELISMLEYSESKASIDSDIILSKRIIHQELGPITLGRALKDISINQDFRYQNKNVKLKTIYNLLGDRVTSLSKVQSGDIFASPDLNNFKQFKNDFQYPFIVVVEPEFGNDRSELRIQMEKLVWEDPSYKLSEDEDTGSMLLLGQGELHLDVFQERLKIFFYKNFTFGELKVARYELSKIMEKQIVFEHIAYGDRISSGKISATLRDTAHFSKQIAFEVSLPEKIQNVVTTAFFEALSRGNHHLEVLGLDCRIHSYESPSISNGEHTLVLLKIAVVSGIRSLIAGCTDLVGPVSELEILVADIYLGSVLSLLQKRGAQIQEVSKKNSSSSIVFAKAGTENLLGFPGALRNMTKGTGVSFQRNIFNSENYNVLN